MDARNTRQQNAKQCLSSTSSCGPVKLQKRRNTQVYNGILLRRRTIYSLIKLVLKEKNKKVIMLNE